MASLSDEEMQSSIERSLRVATSKLATLGQALERGGSLDSSLISELKSMELLPRHVSSVVNPQPSLSLRFVAVDQGLQCPEFLSLFWCLPPPLPPKGRHLWPVWRDSRDVGDSVGQNIRSPGQTVREWRDHPRVVPQAVSSCLGAATVGRPNARIWLGG